MPELSNGVDRWQYTSPATPGAPTNPVFSGVYVSEPVIVSGTPVNDTTMVIKISGTILDTSTLVSPPSYLFVSLPSIIPNQFRPKGWCQVGTVRLSSTSSTGPLPFQAVVHADSSGTITIRASEIGYVVGYDYVCPDLVLMVSQR